MFKVLVLNLMARNQEEEDVSGLGYRLCICFLLNPGFIDILSITEVYRKVQTS